MLAHFDEDFAFALRQSTRRLQSLDVDDIKRDNAKAGGASAWHDMTSIYLNGIAHQCLSSSRHLSAIRKIVENSC